MAFQILSLSGGGFLGLFTISVIAALEEQIGEPIASRFDLIAGTSVGGIIALGLSKEIPARKIKEKFEKNGEYIFSNRARPKGTLSKLIDLCRSAHSPKYTDTNLRQTIIALVGADAKLADLLHPCIVPAVNLTRGNPTIFKTDHHPDFKRDLQLRIVDVALATSAAPTYFPIAEVGDELFADGGLFANSPDLIAIHEAETFFGTPTEEIRILSIGTTTSRFSFSHAPGRNFGVVQWALGQRLVHAMISSQQILVDSMAKHRLGDRYVRLDEVQSREQENDLGLDVAIAASQKTIKGIAEGTIRKFINDPRAGAILAHRPPAPRFYNRSAA